MVKIIDTDGIPIKTKKVSCSFSHTSKQKLEKITIEYASTAHGLDWRMVSPSAVIRDLIYFLFIDEHIPTWSTCIIDNIKENEICNTGHIAIPENSGNNRIVSIIPEYIYLSIESLVKYSMAYYDIRKKIMGSKSKITPASITSDAMEAFVNLKHTPTIGIPIAEIMNRKLNKLYDKHLAINNLIKVNNLE